MDNRLKTLALNIKFARMKKGISQEELAELIDVSRTAISFIETAKQFFMFFTCTFLTYG